MFKSIALIFFLCLDDAMEEDLISMTRIKNSDNEK